MIVSGPIEIFSIGNDELVERWTAEVDGSDVLARVVLTAYQQGFSDAFTSFAEANIFGIFSAGRFTNLGRDARNNAYYVVSCTGVQFDLWGRFVHAYARAAVLPLTSPARVPRLEHSHRRYVLSGGGRVLGHHRISLLTHGSTLDIDEILGTSAADLAARHRLAASHVVVQEIYDGAASDSATRPSATLMAP